MEISKEKSKTIVTGNADDNIRLAIDIEEEKLEQIKSFKYLGSIITENETLEEETQNRIRTATSEMIKFDTVWNLKEISLKNRMKITKAIT